MCVHVWKGMPPVCEERGSVPEGLTYILPVHGQRVTEGVSAPPPPTHPEVAPCLHIDYVGPVGKHTHYRLQHTVDVQNRVKGPMQPFLAQYQIISGRLLSTLL